MKKHAKKNWPVWLLLLFVVGATITAATIGSSSHPVHAASSNAIGLQLTDNGQSSADCSHRDQDGPTQFASVGSWTPWTGDSDNYDPDCIRIYLGNAASIPADTDFRIGIQAQDVNTPCGFLWLFKCSDGGGPVVYGNWVSSSQSSRQFFNDWSSYASDADAWDPDQWRLIFQASSTPWYGHSVTDLRLGVQVNDMASGGGCGGQQTGTPQYTASSTAGGGWTNWEADGVDNQNFNCARINVIATSTLNSPTAILNGTTTAPYGDTINLPWDVEYINTSVGCTLVGSGATSDNRSAYPIKVNGLGSTTTVPIIGTETYTLTCTGLKPGSSVVATKVISTISQPASLEFNMNPLSGLSSGDTSTSTITAINAAQCTLVGKDTNGNIVDPGFTYTPAPPIAGSASTQIAGGTTTLITAGSTWTVPNDWNSSNNTIEVIGGGGGGRYNVAQTGGGGAYSEGVNLVLVPGSTVNYSIGGGGSGGTGSGGGDTWFNATSMANCVSAGPSACVGAKGGGSGGGGGGGQASAGVGTVKYNGGNGGSSNGGGGGAAGPLGDGISGVSSAGGNGGPGDVGLGGSGGSGATCSCEVWAGGGGSGKEWTAGKSWNGSTYSYGNYTAGAGGGGGGTSANCGWSCNWGHGGPGGSYGGGGGSSFSATNGGDGNGGIIVVNYRPANPSGTTVITLTTADSGDWVVPADWNSSNNTIELWGGGGGAGGDQGSTVGTAGATTTFNVTLQAGGGGGGGGAASPVGGKGGIASGGNSANISGDRGSNATVTSGGAGGSSPFGGQGGAATSADSNGNPGSGPGGGGGGGCNTVNCGSAYGGGGGGGGAYVVSQNVSLNPGDHISYRVGTGGAPGVGVKIGGPGADGKIVITYKAPPGAADAHITAQTVKVTTDYTVTCTPYFSGEPTVQKTLRVTVNGCQLDGITVPENGSANFYSQKYPPTGHTCSEYGPVARTCTSGTLSGSASYQYASCFDQSTLSIKANGISPATSVRQGSAVAITWDGGNSTSCTVTGTDGFNAKDADGTTQITGTRSDTITQKTVFTLMCTLGNSTKQSSVTVNLLPTIKEN